MYSYHSAIHEAAHGVMSVRFGRALESITIIGKDEMLGECNVIPKYFCEDDSKETIYIKTKEECIIRLAGITAEKLILGIDIEKCTKHGLMDFMSVETLISTVIKPEQVDSFNKFVVSEAFNIIQQPLVKTQIEEVADDLMKHKTLSGEEVKKIMETIEEKGKS